MFKGKTIYPAIEVGSYWICKSVFKASLSPTDIFAKVIHVNNEVIHIIRKTKYGFEDMAPQTFTIEEFLDLYLKLEDQEC